MIVIYDWYWVWPWELLVMVNAGGITIGYKFHWLCHVSWRLSIKSIRQSIFAGKKDGSGPTA